MLQSIYFVNSVTGPVGFIIQDIPVEKPHSGRLENAELSEPLWIGKSEGRCLIIMYSVTHLAGWMPKRETRVVPDIFFRWAGLMLM